MQLVEGRTAYQGNQVPFTLLWEGGHPNFSEIDPKKVARCLKERLCGICGQMLGKRIAFIGGSRSTVFLDPPNHPACAETAFAACPFLRNERIRDSQDSGEYQIFPASGFDYDPRTLQSCPRPDMIQTS